MEEAEPEAGVGTHFLVAECSSGYGGGFSKPRNHTLAVDKTALTLDESRKLRVGWRGGFEILVGLTGLHFVPTTG